MEQNTPVMPALMRQLHQLLFDYLDDEGMEFEPYKEFRSFKDTQEWFRAWTGNPDIDAGEYLIFGQDGTGGCAAFWLQRGGEDLLQQPIVFFGSEGELGVVARNFSEYLWLLASGLGPCEAVAYPNEPPIPDAAVIAFARQHATTPESRPDEILARANAEFPDFEERIQAICK